MKKKLTKQYKQHSPEQYKNEIEIDSNKKAT